MLEKRERESKIQWQWAIGSTFINLAKHKDDGFFRASKNADEEENRS